MDIVNKATSLFKPVVLTFAFGPRSLHFMNHCQIALSASKSIPLSISLQYSIKLKTSLSSIRASKKVDFIPP